MLGRRLVGKPNNFSILYGVCSIKVCGDMFCADRKTELLYPLPVESVVMSGEALHHEVLYNNEVIQNIFPSYFKKTNEPHFISLPCHCLGALNTGADCGL